MCGICAVAGPNVSLSPEQIAEIAALLSHRGPDEPVADAIEVAQIQRLALVRTASTNSSFVLIGGPSSISGVAVSSFLKSVCQESFAFIQTPVLILMDSPSFGALSFSFNTTGSLPFEPAMASAMSTLPALVDDSEAWLAGWRQSQL